MEFLASFHPQIVHFPIALILVSLLLELVGRLTDLDWWRKAAFTLLILGVLGAGAAVLSGGEAGDKAEHAGVPEAPVDAHEQAAWWTLYLGIGAVVVRAMAGRTGAARGVVATLGLLLHLFTAAAVVKTGYRGGQLVYDHGANVKVNGVPAVKAPPGGEHEQSGRVESESEENESKEHEKK